MKPNFLDPQITKTSYFQKPTKLSRRGYRLSQKTQDIPTENGKKLMNFINPSNLARNILLCIIICKTVTIKGKL